MLRLNQKEDETVTPTPDVDLFAHGHRAFEDGDYEAAADLLRRYLNQHTTGSVPAARKYLGYSLCILERYAEGALELEFVAESEQDEYYFDSLGSAYVRDDSHALAHETFVRGTEAFPASGHLQHRLGAVLEQSGDFSGALIAYRKALQLLEGDDVERVFVEHAMGVIYMNMQKYELAKLRFRSALVGGPTYTTAHLNLLEIARLQLDEAGIREHSEALLVLDQKLIESPSRWEN